MRRSGGHIALASPCVAGTDLPDITRHDTTSAVARGCHAEPATCDDDSSFELRSFTMDGSSSPPPSAPPAAPTPASPSPPLAHPLPRRFDLPTRPSRPTARGHFEIRELDTVPSHTHQRQGQPHRRHSSNNSARRIGSGRMGRVAGSVRPRPRPKLAPHLRVGYALPDHVTRSQRCIEVRCANLVNHERRP